MRSVSATLAALGLALPAAPASAQANDSPQLDRAYLRYAATARTMRKLMDCVARRSPADARAVFDRSPGVAGQDKALGALFDGNANCLSGTGTHELRTSAFMALGTLAENLMQADAVVPAAVRHEPVPPGGGTYEWTILRLTPSYEWKLVPVAQCLAANHPQWAGKLLSTAPVSKDERTLFLTSASQLRDCVPKGEHMTLHPMYLRSAVAMVTYSNERMLKPA